MASKRREKTTGFLFCYFVVRTRTYKQSCRQADTINNNKEKRTKNNNSKTGTATAVTDMLKGKKEWDGNNSSGWGQRRERGKKDGGGGGWYGKGRVI